MRDLRDVQAGVYEDDLHYLAALTEHRDELREDLILTRKEILRVVLRLREAGVTMRVLSRITGDSDSLLSRRTLRAGAERRRP